MKDCLRLRQLARNGQRRYGVPIGNDIRQLRANGRREHGTERGHEHAQPYRIAIWKYSEFVY